MKRFAVVLFCLALVFGGIAGCATSQQKPETPAVVVPDTPPVVEKLTIEDVEFVKQEEKIDVQGCDENMYKEYPYIGYFILSDGSKKKSALVAVWDSDCKNYGLFVVSNQGGQIVAKADTIEDLRTFVLERVKGMKVG